MAAVTGASHDPQAELIPPPAPESGVAANSIHDPATPDVSRAPDRVQVIAQPVSRTPHPSTVATVQAVREAWTLYTNPFIGTHPCILEDGRLTLPAEVCEQLEGIQTLMVTPGPDGCLLLYLSEQFDRRMKEIEKQWEGTNLVRLRRHGYAHTQRWRLDQAGRLSLSKELIRFAGLGEDVVLIGVGEHFELWDAEHWREYRQEIEKDFGLAPAVAQPVENPAEGEEPPLAVEERMPPSDP
jgi:MraZ protein